MLRCPCRPRRRQTSAAGRAPCTRAFGTLRGRQPALYGASVAQATGNRASRSRKCRRSRSSPKITRPSIPRAITWYSPSATSTRSGLAMPKHDWTTCSYASRMLHVKTPLSIVGTPYGPSARTAMADVGCSDRYPLTAFWTMPAARAASLPLESRPAPPSTPGIRQSAKSAPVSRGAVAASLR